MNRIAAVALMLCCAGFAQGAASPQDRARAFAKLPDWTGYWDTAWMRSVTKPSGRNEDLGFAAIARLARLADHPPYNAEWEIRYQAALRNAGAVAANRKQCDWRDFPLTMEAPTTFQIMITPEETMMVFHFGAVRHVFTDGRSHPGADDLWPTRMGHSIGRWEKDVLVIDTIARSPGPVFVGPSADLSEQAQFTERFRLVDADTLENHMTIVDPLRFTKPWEMTIRYTRAVGLDRLIDWNCDGDRNPVVDGKLGVAPP